MTAPAAPPYPGVPYHAAQPVNLRDMGLLMQLMIKHADLRRDMLADPAATLTRLNYLPGPGVVAFFQTLNAANFDAAAAAFTPAHPDPQFGMAEV
jgi:hypothetical protein